VCTFLATFPKILILIRSNTVGLILQCDLVLGAHFVVNLVYACKRFPLQQILFRHALAVVCVDKSRHANANLQTMHPLFLVVACDRESVRAINCLRELEMQ
jgi:hypothetical protein